ncbi:MAG: hypothetical protein KI790_05170 [Cyclobacteriaceae bacterium]|nr:hypothetical protein [Cyclobacteriaceae bacterium HetDA_MAG_MS6]
MVNLKYLVGSALSLPLLPIMYYQGKKIRAGVPSLPEASGPTGICHCAGKRSGRDISLLTIGESTIAGVGVTTHEVGFTGTLATELSNALTTDVRWRVYARSGYTAKKVREKIVPQIVEDTADLIVIGLGANDAFKLNRPSRWRTY